MMQEKIYQTAQTFFLGHPSLSKKPTFTLSELEELIESSNYTFSQSQQAIVILLVQNACISKEIYDKYVAPDTEYFSQFLFYGKNVNPDWITPTARELISYKRSISLFNDPKVIKKIQDEFYPKFVAAAEIEFGFDNTTVKVSFFRLLEILFVANGWQDKKSMKMSK